MAFFDKLNDLAKNVGEKANDAIETTKLNNKINTEKAAIAEEYKKIGEHYYAKHAAGETTESEIDELIASIDLHKTVIMEAEAQIRIAKEESAAPHPPIASVGNIVCSACGKQNSPGTKFCSECGGKLDAQQQPQTRVCPSCKAVVGEGINFCNECGTRIK
jgi:predicted  nucleic acid-binding Zn-ribbon protein